MKKIIWFVSILLISVTTKAQTFANDCTNAIVICGNENIVSNATGIGNTQEIINGCGSSEHNTIWIKINIVQAGTLGFNLIPSDPDLNVDYDFWVFGADRDCGTTLGNPIRCNTVSPLPAPFGANLSANHVVSYVIGSNTWIALGSQSSNDNGLTNIGPLSDIILFTDATSNKYLYIQGNNITSALNTNNYKSFLNSVNLVRWSITNSTWEGIGGNNSLYGMLAIDTSRLMIGTFIFIPSNIITVSNTNPQTILYNGVDYNEIQFNNVGSTISLVWSSALNKWVINAIPVPLLTAITPVS